VVQPRLLDVVVVHPEVVGNFVKEGVVHLVNQFRAGPGPPLDVMLQQDDPLGIPVALNVDSVAPWK